MKQLPMLTDTQMRAIEPFLAPSRRECQAVTAVLFRQTTGIGLRDCADAFGLTRARLHGWAVAMEEDGSLAKIMRALGLEEASGRMWSGGGVPHWRRNSRDGGAGMLEHFLDDFAAQLRSSRRK
jgi:hypothetical protein